MVQVGIVWPPEHATSFFTLSELAFILIYWSCGLERSNNM